MVECTKFKKHESGPLQGFADLYIEKWGVDIHGCAVYSNEKGRWINLPSKEFTNDQGEKKWCPLVKFRVREHGDAFNKIALASIDAWCAANQESPQSSQTSQSGDNNPLPF